MRIRGDYLVKIDKVKSVLRILLAMLAILLHEDVKDEVAIATVKTEILQCEDVIAMYSRKHCEMTVVPDSFYIRCAKPIYLSYENEYRNLPVRDSFYAESAVMSVAYDQLLELGHVQKRASVLDGFFSKVYATF